MAKNTIKMEKVYMYRDGKVSFGSHWSAKGEKKKESVINQNHNDIKWNW